MLPVEYSNLAINIFGLNLMCYQLKQTPEFKRWFTSLRDTSIKNRLLARFARVEAGNLGDHKTIEGELKELRMTFGGGVRVYFMIKENTLALLLQGENKATQQKDIEKAKQLLELWKE